MAVTSEQFYCCPLCGGDVDEMPKPVMCTNCEKHPPIDGDDFCKECVAAEQDEIADIISEREQPRIYTSSLGFRMAS